MVSDHTTWDVDSRAFRLLAWFGVALQFAALVFVVVSQRWGGVPSIAIFLVVSVLFLMMTHKVPSLISFLVVVAAIVNAGGWAWEWYRLVWFDEFVHFFTSMTVVAAILSVAWAQGRLDVPATGAAVIVWAAVIGLGLGILWEIAEALFVSLGLVDTLSDLVLDVIGAALGGLVALWTAQRQSPRLARQSG